MHTIMPNSRTIVLVSNKMYLTCIQSASGPNRGSGTRDYLSPAVKRVYKCTVYFNIRHR